MKIENAISNIAHKQHTFEEMTATFAWQNRLLCHNYGKETELKRDNNRTFAGSEDYE